MELSGGEPMRAIDADAMLARLEEWNTSDSTDKALYNFTLHRILEQPSSQNGGKANGYKTILHRMSLDVANVVVMHLLIQLLDAKLNQIFVNGVA